MVHAAAKGEAYECFVRPDTRIPFMAMPDAVDALMTLAAAPRPAADAHGLQRGGVQSVGGGNPQCRDRGVPPRAHRLGDRSSKRQGIVDTWPADVDDSAARRDWGFAPRFDFERAFEEYLFPTIRERYK